MQTLFFSFWVVQAVAASFCLAFDSCSRADGSPQEPASRVSYERRISVAQLIRVDIRFATRLQRA